MARGVALKISHAVAAYLVSRTAISLFIALGLLLAARYICIGSIELSPDEAYYFMWAQRLDWAYYSKGPGVALAIRAGTALFGENAFGVRFFSPLLSLLTSLIVFFLTRRLYGEPKAVFAVALLNIIPIFNVGSVIMTIDPLSIFFWLAAIATFWLALERTAAFSLWWPLTGLFVGLGFLCKYTNALLLLSIVLVLAVFPRYRRALIQPGFYSLLGVFGLCMLPPLVWNIKNGWVTAHHIWSRGGLTKNEPWSPLEFFEFVGAHLGVYSPLVFVMLVWALVAGLREGRTHYRARFLLCFSLPIIALYFLLSVKEAGEANWTAPGFATLGIYAAHFGFDAVSRRGRRRVFVVAAMIVGILMSILIVNTDLVRVALRSSGVSWEWPYRRDPSARLRGWETAAEGIAALRMAEEERLGKKLFLIANKYGTAAALGFYLPEKRVEGPGHPPIYTPETQAIVNQFAFWPRYDEFQLVAHAHSTGTVAGTAENGLPLYTEERGVNLFQGRDALFITDNVQDDLSRPKGAEVRDGFENTRWLADLIIERRGQRLKVYRVFYCENYKSRDL